MKNFQENQRDVEAPQARDLERTKRLVSIWAELNRNIVYSLPSFLSPVNDRVNVALAMIEGKHTHLVPMAFKARESLSMQMTQTWVIDVHNVL